MDLCTLSRAAYATSYTARDTAFATYGFRCALPACHFIFCAGSTRLLPVRRYTFALPPHPVYARRHFGGLWASSRYANRATLPYRWVARPATVLRSTFRWVYNTDVMVATRQRHTATLPAWLKRELPCCGTCAMARAAACPRLPLRWTRHTHTTMPRIYHRSLALPHRLLYYHPTTAILCLHHATPFPTWIVTPWTFGLAGS